MVKEMLLDFVLFSGIEGIIFCLFFQRIGDCRKFKWYEWLIMSVGNCIISKIFPPMIYQIIMIVWMGMFLCYVINYDKDIFKCLKLPFLTFWTLFIIEVLYSILLEYLLKFESLCKLDTKSQITLFLLTIPMRIIEFIVIKYIKNIRKKVKV